ncbi:MAG: hypothetical protein NFCOHLIN_02493 [Gammaproteobacteria bacterium]|nr:hypothetical protein [Gammaproteobacteria bacterium]
MQHQSKPRVATQYRGIYAMSATIPTANVKTATAPVLKVVAQGTPAKKATKAKR